MATAGDLPPEPFFRSLINFSFAAFNSVMGLPVFRKYTDMPRKVGKFICVYYIFDCVGLEPQYILHHAVALISSSVLAFSRKLEIPFDTYYRFSTLEYSTTILDLYYMTKIFPLKVLFAVTFLYFRVYLYTHWLLFEQQHYSVEFEYICDQHQIYSPDLCKIILYSGSSIIGCFNIFWGYLIVKKMLSKLKSHIKNK